jgi:NADH-quinone oxidoreductase subunit M
MAPEGALALAPFFAALALIGILGMSLVCWVQNDVKRLVAYSSIAHMGLALLAMFAFNVVGMEGGILYMVNHGLSTAGMFMCIGIMYERYHTKDMEVVGGLMQRMPVWSVFMVFFAMASLALPGLNGFVSEFLCLMGIYTADAGMKTGFPGILGPTYAFLAALALVLGALYVLRMLQKFVFGPLREPSHGHAHGGHDSHSAHGHGNHAAHTIQDVNFREILAMAPLAIACIVIGIWPTPILNVIEPCAANAVAPYVKLIERDLANPPRATADDSATKAAAAPAADKGAIQ